MYNIIPRGASMSEEFKWLTQVKKGMLELCCLNLLADDAFYGYELARRLSEIPALVVPLGTVYPLLSRLHQEGWLTSTLEPSPQGPARRKYRLAPDRRERLDEMNRQWRDISQHVEQIISS